MMNITKITKMKSQNSAGLKVIVPTKSFIEPRVEEKNPKTDDDPFFQENVPTGGPSPIPASREPGK